VLEADPGDVTAQAALINLRGQSDTGQSESRLKTLLASQPDSSALHFALGNCMPGRVAGAKRSRPIFRPMRWSRTTPTTCSTSPSASIICARTSWRHSTTGWRLSAAETRRSAFDKDAAGKRILELQP
jgi:hypothetical protein